MRLAEHLGHENIVELLQETLDEESAADEKLTSLSLDEILPNAETGEEEAAAHDGSAGSRRNVGGARR